MSEVVVVSSSGSGQSDAGTGANKVTEVARAVGGHDEPEVRSQALSCINRVREHINGMDWRFLKTNAANITLVSGTATYSLPTNFKAPSYARLLDSNGLQDSQLMYVPDEVLTQMIYDQESSGKPYYYSLRNHYADGLVTLYPTPGSSEAANNTLDVEYYKRIPVITDDTARIDVPEEVNRVLAIGGQYELLVEREKNSPVIPLRRADYLQAMNDLKNFDRRVGEERARFRIGGLRSPFGTVYIRA